MAEWLIEGPRSFHGSFSPPGDKSISHRAVMAGALAEGKTAISNFLASDDCLRTLQAFQAMGIRAEFSGDDSLSVWGGALSEPELPLDMGNSGTGVRLLSGILAGHPFLSIVTGDESIRRRPMKRVCEPLRKMGATILARSGDLAPLAIRGGCLNGIEYQSPVASAQVKSCLLFAGMFAEGQTRVSEPSISRDHTERMLKAFGAKISRDQNSVTIEAGSSLQARDVEVPGDISSAAFFIAGALIIPNSELKITNVGLNPTRTGLLDAFIQMGADIAFEDVREASGEPIGTVRIRTSHLTGQTFGGELIPRMIDEIPVLALAAAFAEGETIVRDASELRVKESDRIATVTEALSQFGADITPMEDGMIIRGGRALRAASIHSRGDHRIAMMGAIAAQACSGESRIAGVECVHTSFPNFYNLLQLCTE